MQTALVTGADKGLGFSLAKKFLEESFRVIAGRLGGGEQLNQLRERFGKHLLIVQQDVSDLKSVIESAQKAAQWTDHLDVLINNAGIYLRPQNERVLSDLDLSDGSVQKMMEVNALGPMRVTQQFLPLLRHGTRKRIVNISSEAASLTNNWRTDGHGYCMSKTALNMHCAILQRWLQPEGFKVLAIHPGWVRSDMSPTGTVPPDESAAGIFALASRDWPADAPIFMDYTGKPME
jgi:NAD(P)-dependent dehydrogenase (short-subunit alcohol dehydrogenase family)